MDRMYLCFVCSLTTHKNETEDYLYNLEGQLAIQGYDPVAYFKQGRAVKGRRNFQQVMNYLLFFYSR
jgi:hypothetical protein